MMTALVILSTGEHLCLNSGSNPWEAFRKVLLQNVIDLLVVANEPGAHVVCAAIAHDDHFHLVDSQAQLFAALAHPALDASGAAVPNDHAKDRTCH